MNCCVSSLRFAELANAVASATAPGCWQKDSFLRFHPSTTTSQLLTHPHKPTNSILSNTDNSRHQTYSNRKRTKNHSHFDSTCLLPSSPIGTSTPSVWVRRELRWRQRQTLRAWSIIVKYCNRNLMRESVFSFYITREPLCFEALANCCCETGASKHTSLHRTPSCRRALPNWVLTETSRLGSESQSDQNTKVGTD